MLPARAFGFAAGSGFQNLVASEEGGALRPLSRPSHLEAAGLPMAACPNPVGWPCTLAATGASPSGPRHPDFLARHRRGEKG